VDTDNAVPMKTKSEISSRVSTFLTLDSKICVIQVHDGRGSEWMWQQNN